METITIELEGKFEGWQAVMDGDPDWEVFQELDSGSITRVSGALLSVLKDWNFKTAKGEAVPANAEGLKRVPGFAVRQLLQRYGRYFLQLPNQYAGA